MQIIMIMDLDFLITIHGEELHIKCNSLSEKRSVCQSLLDMGYDVFSSSNMLRMDEVHHQDYPNLCLSSLNNNRFSGTSRPKIEGDGSFWLSAEVIIKGNRWNGEGIKFRFV